MYGEIPSIKASVLTSPYFLQSGTTWTQEIVYWLRHGCEMGETRTASFNDIFPELETANAEGHTCTLERLSNSPRPFNIKSHLPVRFFKRYLDQPEICPKFVVVMRNVKDVIVSFYHYHTYFEGCDFKSRTFDEFFAMFKDQTMYRGDPIDHMIGWWNYKDHPNVHILFYEDMLRDSLKQIKTIGNFIGCPVSDDTAQRIKDGCSFPKMRERGLEMYIVAKFNEGTTFFRKGGIGDWKKFMSAEQAKYVDDLVREKCHPLGLYI